MKRALFLAGFLICGLVGCTADAPKDAFDVEAEKLASPLYQNFEAASDATAWLMDTKHTLRGVGMEEANQLCRELLEKGAIELRAADIVPDPNDRSYASANRLLVKLPRDAKERSEVLALVDRWNKSPAPTADSGQEIAEIRF